MQNCIDKLLKRKPINRDPKESLEDVFVKELSAHIAALNLDEEQERQLIQCKCDEIPNIILDLADSVLEDLKGRAPRMLKERRSERSGFEKRNRRLWKSAFDLFEMFLVIAYEVGSEFNDEYRKGAANQPDYIFNALVRLHARGCQIGYEILALINSGFADAAHARWRTLHECAVVAFFIAKHGQNVAERYLLFDAIESYKAMVQYQRYAIDLGEEPFTEEEIQKKKSIYDALLKRFGSDFKNRNGWATDILKMSDVPFDRLEEEAGLAHLRPYYKMASDNIHGNYKGLAFKLGLIPECKPVLLAGPSNYGYADPANGAAISLTQISVALLNTRPSIERLATLNIMQKLIDEIGEEFVRIQQEVEKMASKQNESP